VQCKGGECSDAALSPFVSPSTATVIVRAVLQFANATDEQRSRFVGCVCFFCLPDVVCLVDGCFGWLLFGGFLWCSLFGGFLWCSLFGGFLWCSLFGGFLWCSLSVVSYGARFLSVTYLIVTAVSHLLRSGSAWLLCIGPIHLLSLPYCLPVKC